MQVFMQSTATVNDTLLEVCLVTKAIVKARKGHIIGESMHYRCCGFE
jgi:hypothetical protein